MSFSWSHVLATQTNRSMNNRVAEAKNTTITFANEHIIKKIPGLFALTANTKLLEAYVCYTEL